MEASCTFGGHDSSVVEMQMELNGATFYKALNTRMNEQMSVIDQVQSRSNDFVSQHPTASSPPPRMHGSSQASPQHGQSKVSLRSSRKHDELREVLRDEATLVVGPSAGGFDQDARACVRVDDDDDSSHRHSASGSPVVRAAARSSRRRGSPRVRRAAAAAVVVLPPAAAPPCFLTTPEFDDSLTSRLAALMTVTPPAKWTR